MIIGIDMDSVIAEIVGPMDAYHNRVYGTKLKLEDHEEYDLRSYWNCSHEQMFERIFSYYNAPEFKTVKPIQGSQDVIKQLGKKHSLHLITSRPYSIEKQSHAWLDIYFPQVFNSIHHTNQISEKGYGQGIKKSTICLQIQADIMIDDHIENAIDCADYEIKTLLFSAPWNKKYTSSHPYIQKVKSWNEILSIVF